MSVKWSFSGQCKEKATNTAAIPVLIRLGAHPPDGRLRLAFQCPTWGWEVLAFATHAKGLTGFIFLFLQRPHYRVIANIEDGAVRILVLKVGNRREIYR